MNKMKIIIGSLAVIAIAVVTAVNVSFNIDKTNPLSLWALANVEALAQEGTGNHCPDPYDVPHRYIKVEAKTEILTSNSKGEVSYGSTVKAGYEKNKQVSVNISIYNCDGTQDYACCKQSDVRTIIN